MAQGDPPGLRKQALAGLPPWTREVVRRLVELQARAAAAYEKVLPLLAPSETKFLVAMSVLIGLSTGIVTFLFDRLIALVLWAGLGRYADLAHLPPQARWHVLFLPALGGLVVGPLIKHFSPESRGEGVPTVIWAMHRQGGRMKASSAWLKALASAITIGTGGSAGREGPVVMIGASIGSSLAQLFRMPAVTLKTMAAAGSAAGIAAAFNAPLGGMMFSLEVVLGEITAGPFAMVVLATVVASAVSRGLHGSEAFFSVHSYALNHWGELGLYVLLGALAGTLSKLFVWLFFRIEDEFEHRTPLDPMWRPALGGLLVGAVGFFAPGALGPGYAVIGQALEMRHGFGALGLLLGGKMLATALTLGSGGSGGTLMPSLFMGAMLGSLLGRVFGQIIPFVIDPGAYAAVGMAAFFAGMVHAPLAAILILFEMTYDYNIILPLMAAVVTSVMVGRVVEPESIYSLKLLRQGIKIRHRAETSLLTQTPVSDIMTRKVMTLEAGFPIGRLGRHFNKTRRSGFPVVDKDGRLLGLLTFAEAQAAYSADPPPPADTPVEKIMRAPGPPLYPDDPVSEAVRRMHQEDVDRLPVVSREDPRKLVGVVSRTDLLDLYGKRIA